MARGTDTRYAAAERDALADTLAAVGPTTPTCCEGWLSRDLAAHLVLREHRPFAALGIVVKPLAPMTDRLQRRLAAGDYAHLVESVRTRPRWGPTRFDRLDEAINLVEFFVHHEDVRRAAGAWVPRELDPGYAAALWGRVPMFARVRLARSPHDVTVRAPGHGEVTVRGGRLGRERTQPDTRSEPTPTGRPAPTPATAPIERSEPAATSRPEPGYHGEPAAAAAGGSGTRTVVGAPGELLLYLFGRHSIADVNITD